MTAETLRLVLRVGLAGLTARNDRERAARNGEAVADALERLGGSFQKCGQFLASRPDLLGEETRRALGRLCDRAEPLPEADARRALTAALSPAQRRQISYFDPLPIACGSVAQVHLVTLRDGRVIALKLLRPETRRRFQADLALARAGATVLGRLRRFRSVPVLAAFAQLSESLTAHLDLRLEAGYHRLFRERLSGDRVIVPELAEDLCGERVLAMEYVSGAARVDDPSLQPGTRRAALRVGLHVLYRMIFELGVVHCDFHPGNLLVTPSGELVVLDFGYVATASGETQRQFRDFFLAIALEDAELAARVIVETADDGAPADPGGLERDLRRLLQDVHGLSAGEFQVAGLVLRLFEIQRSHGILATPAFTMMILALVSYEGLLKLFEPSLDFQREAMPHLVGSLELRSPPSPGEPPRTHAKVLATS